jgi:hypothetical protein
MTNQNSKKGNTACTDFWTQILENTFGCGN